MADRNYECQDKMIKAREENAIVKLTTVWTKVLVKGAGGKGFYCVEQQETIWLRAKVKELKIKASYY